MSSTEESTSPTVSETSVSSLPAIVGAIPDTVASVPRAEVVRALLALSSGRRPGSAAVAVRRPGDSSGLGAAVQVVTDDMVGLVDAVTALLSAEHADVVDLVHPVVGVEREDDGTVVAVRGAGEANSSPESWIHIALRAGALPSVFDAIETGLPMVLAALRQVDADAAAMAAVRREVAVGLGPSDASVSALLLWLSEERFRLLGYRYDGRRAGIPHPRALGIDRDTASVSGPTVSGPSVSGPTFGLERASVQSPVARSRVPYVLVVRDRDVAGEVVGEHRFTGLFTVAALSADVLTVPIVGERIRAAVAATGHTVDSHSGESMTATARAFPLPELLTVDTDVLGDALVAVDEVGVRREVVLFVRADPGGRFVSATVFLPRSSYTTRVVDQAGDILRDAYGGERVDFSARVSESPLAAVSFLVHLPAAEPGGTPEPVDTSESARLRVQAAIEQATRTWEDGLLDEAEKRAERASTQGAPATGTGFGELAATVDGLLDYAEVLPEAYKEDFDARRAVADIDRVCAMEAGSIDTLLYRAAGAPDEKWRFSLYATGVEISLGQVLPVLQSLGVEVIDERPYELSRPDGTRCWIYDFGLRVGPDVLAGDEAAAVAAELDLFDNSTPGPGADNSTPGPGADNSTPGPGATRFTDAFEAVWRGEAEADRFNELVLRAGLHWREAVILRAYAKYLRQAGFIYSQYTIEGVLLADPRTARLLVELFCALFDPDAVGADPAAAAERAADLDARVVAVLDRVVSLDTDRILRALLSLVRATLRTNYFCTAERTGDATEADGTCRPVLSVKLDPRAVDEVPAPRPHVEVFVYSPRVEGVHLRFGPVARGGLRWSDRREDFRTEVLGLAKAQAVKNAVIVPVGAKGGFVVKNPPSPSGDGAADRAAAFAEGQDCYRWFVRGLLDITDNLDRATGSAVPPPRVVRRDGDDTYLVVAADKGTASFSDMANAVAAEYDFWLGDAFASGGSVGYDHKAMGITARGAWESVKRHFRELGLDPEVDEVSVVGIGDMSGDVFGNGMLLSDRLKLIGAFDHRHIFLDPDPDPARAFAERARLFGLPRSSWADFDTAAISDGGGVWERTRKSVPVSARARTVLGIESEATELSPDEVIRALLSAPVDLLWNGGIGTYVKARAQSDADVGDKANDSVRVDAADLRARVVGEGGNLGFTQAGRVEFARAGGKINTDAVDNSAGVDCSDHEVNIKILLDSVVASGALTETERNELLASMTDEVASLVLADNVAQNELLGTSRCDAVDLMNVHARLISDLVERVALDRELEALPSRHEAARRIKFREGLSSPELATLMAHVKLALEHDVAATDLPDSDAFVGEVTEYFPAPLRERFGEAIAAHPLRRAIVATRLANRVVDNGGITYAFRLGEDSGVNATDAVRAFTAATSIFGLTRVWETIASTPMPTAASDLLVLESRRLLDRASRWLLANRPQPVAVRAEITRFAQRIARLEPQLTGWLGIRRVERAAERAQSALDAGAPRELALRVHGLLDLFCLLDVIESADMSDHEDADVAELYFLLDDRLGVDRLLSAVSRLERGDRWHSLARLALRDDLYTSLRSLTLDVLHGGEPGEGAAAMIEDWERSNASRLRRARSILADIEAEADLDLPTLSVAAGQVRSMVRVTGTRSEGSR